MTGAIFLTLPVVGAAAGALRLPSNATLQGYGAPRYATTGRIPGGVAPLSPRLLDPLFGAYEPGSVETVAPDQSTGPHAAARVPVPAQATGPVVTHRFTNDNFGQAFRIPAVPFRASTSTAGATRERDEPSACSPVGGTAWYRYTAAATSGLFASTFGTEYADSLAVFTGPDERHLTRLGCSTSSKGNAQVGFGAQNGRTYYLRVTGVTGGRLSLQLDRIGPTEDASVDDAGNPAATPSVPAPGNVVPSEASYPQGISSDGNLVLFASNATNLDPQHSASDADCVPVGLDVAPDTAGRCFQVFLRDRRRHTTTLVSAGSLPPNGPAGASSMSVDGRYVAFASDASNIVVGDTDGVSDVFVKDMLTGTVTLESVGPDGQQATTNDSTPTGARAPRLSSDGRWLVFDSDATNFGTFNDCTTYNIGCLQTFLKDLVTGRMTLVGGVGSGGFREPDNNVFNNGLAPDGSVVGFMSAAKAWGQPCTESATTNDCVLQKYVWSRATHHVTCLTCDAHGHFGDDAGRFGQNQPDAFSMDGHLVGFGSRASNLVPNDTNDLPDEFVLDLTHHRLRRVSLTADGGEIRRNTSSTDAGAPAPAGANAGQSAGFGDGWIAMSADGRYVTFETEADNVTAGDTDGVTNTYLHDLVTGSVTLVSVTSEGKRLPGVADILSPDGRWVVFGSSLDGRAESGVQAFVHRLSGGRP